METMRPPLGVMPNEIWVEKRKLDLSRAIHDYIVDRHSCNLMVAWLDELKDLVTRYP